MIYRIIRSAAAAALLLGIGVACDGAPEPEGAATDAATRAEAGALEGVAEAAGEVVVYKSPTCGCCNGWVEHMEASGFTVRTVDLPMYDDLAAKKHEHGVPGDLGSCHTATVDGYVVEGHVPADAVKRMLADRPDVKGIAVPGMPVGSPGMEGANPERYDVVAFDGAGNRTVFESVDPTRADDHR